MRRGRRLEVMAEVWRIGNDWSSEWGDQGTLGDGTARNDGKEARKDWGEQGIGCSPKTYRNLIVESGGSSGGMREGGKRLDWRSRDSTRSQLLNTQTPA